MRTILTTTAALLALGAPAFAQSLDTDGDGNVTLAEVQVAYPEMTQEDFTAMDTDEDGVLNGEEVQAATDAGLLGA